MTTQERAERFVEEGHQSDKRENRTVEVGICRLCGFMSWQGSRDPGKGFKVVLNTSASWCARCHEAHARAPEVFYWVSAIAEHHGLLAEEKHEPDPPSTARDISEAAVREDLPALEIEYRILRLLEARLIKEREACAQVVDRYSRDWANVGTALDNLAAVLRGGGCRT
jgi:hypothetical protein